MRAASELMYLKEGTTIPVLNEFLNAAMKAFLDVIYALWLNSTVSIVAIERLSSAPQTLAHRGNIGGILKNDIEPVVKPTRLITLRHASIFCMNMRKRKTMTFAAPS